MNYVYITFSVIRQRKTSTNLLMILAVVCHLFLKEEKEFAAWRNVVGFIWGSSLRSE